MSSTNHRNTECPASQIPKDLSLGVEYLLTSLSLGQTLIHFWSTTQETVIEFCNVDHVPPVFQLFHTASSKICSLANTLQELSIYLKCQDWYPLYAKLAHDDLCYKGAESVIWVTASQLVVIFWAMVVLTCRTAFINKFDTIPNDLILIIEENRIQESSTSKKMNEGNEYCEIFNYSETEQ